MLAAQRFGQDERRVALVHEEHLATEDRAVIRRDHAERNALAHTGRTDPKGVPGIRNVEVEPPRRAAGRGAVAERRRVLRIVRARIDGQPRPDAGKRHDVGEVAGAYERLPDVVPAVDRDRPEPGLYVVDGLDARIEAHVLADLEDQPRALIGLDRSVRGDDDPGRGVAEADVAGLRLGDRIIRVGRHLERVLVLESRRRTRPDGLADYRAGALALLQPVSPMHAEL